MNSARMLGFGVWRSLVARLVRDEKVEGSNPFTPTSFPEFPCMVREITHPTMRQGPVGCVISRTKVTRNP